MLAQEKVLNSEFTIMANGNLSVENAVIIWPNLEGRPTEFNAKGGKRTFALVLNAEIANDLADEGWNIKTRDGKEEGEEPLIFTEIVVNMDSKYPPKIFLITSWNGETSANQLRDDMVGEIDDIIISGNCERSDLIVHPYEHNRDPKNRVKGYLDKLYLTKRPNDDFGGRYANVKVKQVAQALPISPEDETDDIPF